MDMKSLGRKLWKDWIKPFAIIFAILGTFRSAVADWNDVPSGSMEPTILVGDRILVNKLAYGLRVPFTRTWVTHWNDPARGEIVILFAPDSGKRLVKRLVAVPGDVIEMTNNRLSINGVPLSYGPLDAATIKQDVLDKLAAGQNRSFAAETLGAARHAVMGTPSTAAHRSFKPITVPEGQFFVMGDNRDMSADSRAFGFVPRGQIVGRSSAVAFSLDRENSYLPRWDRFFKSLP